MIDEVKTVESVNEQAFGEPSLNDPNSIELIDILVALSRRRRLIGYSTLICLLIGILISFLLKPTFTATAIILPPQQQTSTSSLMNQMGSLAALTGGTPALGLKTPADLYIGILESRTIADELVAKFHLQAVYRQETLQDTRTTLKNNTKLDAGKDGLIHIAVTDHDPNRASDIANGYVTALHGMNSNMVATEASQRKVFFDEQLDGERKALAASEENLRSTEQRTGVIQLTGQAEMIIRTIANLRAQIASREVELQAMRTYATDQNPDVSRIQEEISTMRAQLAKLENGQERQAQPGDISLPAGSVPEDSLEYARNLREVKYHEALFDLLSKQYEAARIDEAKSAPVIQVIDHAVAPDKKSGPHRSLIVLAAMFSGFFITSVYVLLLNLISKSMQNNPAYARKLAELRSQG
jgi:uncharacterized protein involved in exopolysaccharide biosynthesis